MSDKSLGSLIFALGLIGSIVYVYWLFAPVTDLNNLVFYAPNIGVRWALVLPIVVAVIGVLVIAMWIGWTMIATPPPMVIEEMESEEPKEGV